ncbi:MAG: GNAT family N-acetyltransferase [Arenicellales bacterium]
MIIATTGRLVLREAVPGDAAFMLELMNEPPWRAFIARHSITTISRAAKYMEDKMMSAYARHGFGLWVVEILSSSMTAGICGLVKRGTLEHADLGFAFLGEFWGQGYALEACRAVLEYAARRLEMAKVLAITDPGNRRSIHVLDKLGFRYESTFSHPGANEILSLYAIESLGPGADPECRAGWTHER